MDKELPISLTKHNLNRRKEEMTFHIKLVESEKEGEQAAKALAEIMCSSEPTHLFRSKKPEDVYPYYLKFIIQEALPLKICYVAKHPETDNILGLCYGRDFTNRLTLTRIVNMNK